MRTLNNKTRSLCNVCYREIPAQVYEKDRRVLIQKSCPRHGTFTGLVEKDPTFYRWFSGIYPRKYRRFTTLLLPVTYRCDLDCRYCFSIHPGRPDMTFDEITQAVKNFKGRSIELSGGEPTLRKDLPLIIKMANDSGKEVILETNGLKLADMQYLKRLKKAGLGQVLFSLDSLKIAFYNKISAGKQHLRRNVLAIKSKALVNLEREGIPTILSATIYRGLNDRELNDLFMFAARRNGFISQIRFRGCVDIGSNRSDPHTSYTLSELFSLFAKQMHMDREDLKVHFLKSRLGRSLILDFKGPINGKRLEVKIVSWPTVENIDLGDLKTSMAYLTHQKKLLKFFYGVIADRVSSE